MPSTVPTPVAAAIGLVPTVLGGVRRLPVRAVQLPVIALGSALGGLATARREYDDLAERGERLLARLRGTSFDEVEDAVEDALQGTPLAKPYDRVEDALEDAGEAVASVAAKAASRARGGARGALKTVADRADDAADVVEDAAEQVAGSAGAAASKAVRNARGAAQETAEAVADAAEAAAAQAPAAPKAGAKGSAPKGAPTPKATQPDDTRIDTAASPDVVAAVEQAAAGASQPVSHDALPLPDYDHMTLGSLRGRLRSLSVDELVTLRTYEKAHADRLPVVTMLDNRIAKLSTDPSAAPNGSGPAGTPPELQPSQIGQGGSKVTPATAGQTPGQDPFNPRDPQ